LSEPRRALVLRTWLQRRQGRGMEESLLARLLVELAAAAKPATWPAIGGELRRYRGQLLWTPRATATPGTVTSLAIHQPGCYEVEDWGGALVVQRVDAGGVLPQWLHHLQLRPRSGAERFQARAGSPPRSLKKQFQAAGVPAWAREGPLVYAGDRLLYVPGLGTDARCLAPAGAEQWRLEWRRGQGKP
jgi:tRNA(Ile)-lysidine synthase